MSYDDSGHACIEEGTGTWPRLPLVRAGLKRDVQGSSPKPGTRHLDGEYFRMWSSMSLMMCDCNYLTFHVGCNTSNHGVGLDMSMSTYGTVRRTIEQRQVMFEFDHRSSHATLGSRCDSTGHRTTSLTWFMPA